ncbi:hypothetical protein BHE74_00024462 [Ensete ventricosum]|nr:hypothetical protein BHE74_00024462 [Ensete ventricosum]
MQRKARRQAGHNPWHGSHSRRSSITSQGKSRPLMATDETLGGDHSTVSCGKSSMRRQYAPSSPSAAALRSEAREVLCSLQPAIHRRRERRSTFSSAHVSAAGDRKLSKHFPAIVVENFFQCEVLKSYQSGFKHI